MIMLDSMLIVFIVVLAVALLFTIVLIVISGSHKRKVKHDTKEFEFERYTQNESIF